MNDGDVHSGLLAVEGIVKSAKFEAWRKKFVADNSHVFDFEDENKLQYTEIHHEYEGGIEALILENMPKDFDMAGFMTALPTYLDGPGGKSEDTGAAVNLLCEVSDFSQFKEMMLYAKQQAQDGQAKAAQGGDDVADFKRANVLEVDGMLDLCASLAASSERDHEWTTVFQNSWMRIDKKAVEDELRTSKNQIYLRGVMTMNLSYVESVDMLMYFGERRMLWDKNYKGFDLPGGGDVYDDDVSCLAPCTLSVSYLTRSCRRGQEVIIRSHLDFGRLMHMAGIPRSLCVKYLRRWDVPYKGAMSFAMVPWDVEKNAVDHNNSILSIKTHTFTPHPTDASKSIITTLEINKLGVLPKWALNLLMTATAPQLMRGLEQRYIANVRNKDGAVDLTPEGRKSRAPGATVW